MRQTKIKNYRMDNPQNSLSQSPSNKVLLHGRTASDTPGSEPFQQQNWGLLPTIFFLSETDNLTNMPT